MWVRKRLEIGWNDLLYGIASCLRITDRPRLAKDVEAVWSESGDAFCCLSVRSGWDLLLRALDLPKGSEVLVSALTIKDMVRIIEEQGLVPVPIDFDSDRLEVSMECVERALTPKTRAVLVAHLFGTQTEIGPLMRFARQHNLLVVEDCAQAFTGVQDAAASEADVSMYSFGNIKTATALGGGIFRVRDAHLLARMRELHAEYPVQGRGTYFRRLLKYSLLKAISVRSMYFLFVRFCRWFGTDHDLVASRTVRGFAGPDFYRRIRQQPSTPLLSLLYRRLSNFDRDALLRRAYTGQMLRDLLDEVVECPGGDTLVHSYWVFPILVDDVETMIAALRQAGFDATQAQSLSPVEPPEQREALDPVMAKRLLKRTIYLPCYPELPSPAVERMALAVRATAPPRTTVLRRRAAHPAVVPAQS